MSAWLFQFLIIILLYQEFASGYLQKEDGYSQLRKYLKSKLTKLSWPNLDLVETHWIEQPVDHFNSSDSRSWQMRYFQNLKFFKVGGPIFLFIGGEEELDPVFLTKGLIFEFAMTTSSAMFASEHRYYGESNPGDNTNLEDLRHLNSKQAITDIVQLLVKLKRDQKFKSSKVVVIGGSYPGMLAAWARLLHPEVIDAAVASSAPVLAKFDFYEYLETCGEDYKKYGTPGCYDRISDVFKALTDAFETPEGIEQLKKKEYICESSDLSRKDNQYFFLNNFLDTYITQNANVNVIKNTCKDVFSERFLNESSPCDGIDYNKYIQDTKRQGNSWLYQTCSEFGFFQTTSSNKQPFGKQLTLEILIEECNLIYGPDFNAQSIEEAVNKTNEFYGGLKPNVTKVVFTNGELDPWHKLGVLEDLNPDAPARVIPKMSHCKDLFGEDYNDSKEFIETVQFVKKTIKQWIGL